VRTLKVGFEVVTVVPTVTTSNITRYYHETPETIFDIIHDYLTIFFKHSNNIGYVNISIDTDEGKFNKSSMKRLRDIIVDKILGYAVGDVPITQLQQTLLYDRLNSGRPKK
jgi:hypothetical protein